MGTQVALSAEQELARASELLKGTVLPSHVLKVDAVLRPGDDGQRQLWIRIRVPKRSRWSKSEIRKLNEFASEQQTAILETDLTLFPYYSIEESR